MSSSEPDTRQRILAATCELLEHDTNPLIRMADVAKRAGISRQALYLHFPTRADLLIATVRCLDDLNEVDMGLAASRAATSGLERLDRFIEAWGSYIPKIHGTAKALIAMKDADEAAAAAWDDRMQAIRHGCDAIVKALKKDGTLSPDTTPKQATDILWMLLSIQNWEHLTQTCNWPQKRYISTMKHLSRQVIVAEDNCTH